MKIVFEDTDLIDQHSELAAEFFDYLEFDMLFVSNDTDLRHMASEIGETGALWAKITEKYGIERTDVPNELLISIFEAIARRRTEH